MKQIDETENSELADFSSKSLILLASSRMTSQSNFLSQIDIDFQEPKSADNLIKNEPSI